MLYNSNFDSSNFKQSGSSEFNKTRDDPCAQQQRLEGNEKKLKFVTTNFRDLQDAKESLNFYGMTIKDTLFVPSAKIDQDSALRQGDNGGVLTQCNTKNGFGALPLPTMPSRFQMYHGDVYVEDTMRNTMNTNRKSCFTPTTEFFNRYFYIFKNVEVPDPSKSVETDAFGPRGGASTRFMKH
jgi:hypothetical protein